VGRCAGAGVADSDRRNSYDHLIRGVTCTVARPRYTVFSLEATWKGLHAAREQGAALDIKRHCKLVTPRNLKRKHSQHIRHAAAHCPSMQHGVRIPAPRSGMTTPPLHARPPSTTCIAIWSTFLHSSCCTCRCVLRQGAGATLHPLCLPAAKIFCQHWHAQPVHSLQVQTGACARLKGGLSVWKNFAKLLHIHVRLQAAHVICW